MRIVFFGDVVGRSGREGLERHVPVLKQRLRPDFIVANVENAAAGFGVTPKLVAAFHAMGIDVLTTGNHVWGQKELVGAIDRLPTVLRPLNYPAGTPGRGVVRVGPKDGPGLVVVNVMARLFMEPFLDDPFAATEAALRDHPLGRNGDAILVDIHGETTAEKYVFGHVFDGRVSAVIGTHTHVPTADAHILPGGTAFQSDAGMCGDYDSAIGMKKETAIARIVQKTPGARLSPAEGEATVCGCLIETDDVTGLAVKIEPVRAGGILKAT